MKLINNEFAAKVVIALTRVAREAAENATAAADLAERQAIATTVDLQDQLENLKAISNSADAAAAAAGVAEDAFEWVEVAELAAYDEACLTVDVDKEWFETVSNEIAKTVVLDDTPLLEFVEEAKGYAETARAAVGRAAESKKVVAKATSAMQLAVCVLQVNEFFELHKEQIYAKLEDCDAIASEAGWNKDMIFIAESLPIINGIIHVGSTSENMDKAVKWVRINWVERSDPLIVLSALIFRYVAYRGLQDNKHNVTMEKRVIWKRIDSRAQKLL